MKEHTSKFSFYVVCFQNKKSWIFQILLWFIVFNLENEKKKKLNFKSTLRLYGQLLESLYLVLFVVKQLLFYHFLLIIFLGGGGCWLGGVGVGVANENIHDTQTGEKQEQEFWNKQCTE